MAGASELLETWGVEGCQRQLWPRSICQLDCEIYFWFLILSAPSGSLRSANAWPYGLQAWTWPVVSDPEMDRAPATATSYSNYSPFPIHTGLWGQDPALIYTSDFNRLTVDLHQQNLVQNLALILSYKVTKTVFNPHILKAEVLFYILLCNAAVSSCHVSLLPNLKWTAELLKFKLHECVVHKTFRVNLLVTVSLCFPCLDQCCSFLMQAKLSSESMGVCLNVGEDGRIQSWYGWESHGARSTAGVNQQWCKLSWRSGHVIWRGLYHPMWYTWMRGSII